jgi:small GTP-binding protein
MDLHEYERVKFALADILRGLALAGIRQGARGPDQLRDLFGRLADDRFNLAVVGRFNRGKTSLMNAMLGMDRLPTGVVPLTSVITAVSYGSEPKAVLHYQNTSLFMDVTLEELPRHITERGNPGNIEGVSVAEVQLPADILRFGFHFIDTPGLGSAIAENTRTTERFLPEADALLLVTSYDSALTEEEWRTLEQAQTSGCRTFVVLNKQDAVGPAERDEVFAHVRDRLVQLFGTAAPPLFSVSATQALAARLAGDQHALEVSGLPAFEDVLTRFLVEDRRQAFLVSICGRIEGLLRQAGADALLDDLVALRSNLAVPATAVPMASAGLPARTSPLADCEICAVLTEEAVQFLSRFQLSLYGDRQAQEQLAARGGLCDAHLPQLEALAAPREIATGFAPVLAAQAARLRALARHSPTGRLACDAVTAAQSASRICLVCDAVAPAGTAALRRMAARVVQSGPAAIYRNAAPCLRHFGELVHLVEDAGVVGDLLDLQAALMERLEEDLRRLSLRQDAAQRHAASAEERAAPVRALYALASAPAARLAPEVLRPVRRSADMDATRR